MFLKNKIFQNKVLKYCLGAALILSALIGLNRIWLEIRNMQVEMIMGWNDVRKLQYYSDVSYDQLLTELKASGIIGIAIEEDTLASLKANGDISWYKGEDLLAMSRSGQIQNYALGVNARQAQIKPGFHYVMFDDAETYNRSRDALVDFLGPKAVKEMGGYILEIRPDIPHIDAIGLGISQRNFLMAKNYGFLVIPHLMNKLPMKEEIFTQKLSQLENTEGVSTVIFSGNGGIEYKGAIPLIVSRFKQSKLNLGVIEFDSKKGAKPITREIPNQTIGVHFIGDGAMRTMTPGKAVARYVMAVAERGMRILYVRPLLNAPEGQDLLPYNSSYISLLQKTLLARHFVNMPIEGDVLGKFLLAPNVLFVLILAFGVAASLIIFLTLFYDMTAEAISTILTLFAVVTAGAFLTDKLLLWRSFLALIVTMIYPVYALIVNVPDKVHDRSEDPLRWRFGVRQLWQMVLIVLVGALLVVGILSDPHYMLKIEEFTGVKLAYAFPVLFVIWYYLLYPDKIRSLKFIVRRRLQLPLTLGALAVTGLVAFVAMYYVGRSGNYSIPVFAGEDFFRQLLNTIFFVRPRTKEFLIGYPVFLLFLSYWGNRVTVQWRWLFMAFAVMAPVSLLNTFCHIHAPLLLSVVRVFNGFLLGAVMGLVYIVSVRAMLKMWKFFAY